jgi:Protein of unknown function (DUF3313)
VDLDGAVAPFGGTDESMKRANGPEKVGVETELVDSQSGEQIAALVNKERLGAGDQNRSASFSRDERFAGAKSAFDEWASLVRTFLNSAHQLTG